MGHPARLLKIIFVILLLTTIGEVGYYIYYQFNKDKQKSSNLTKETPTVIPKINTSVSKEDLEFILDSRYQSFSPLTYDENKDRFYMDIPGKTYVEKRRRMGVNYAAWIAISTYIKSQVEYIIMNAKLKGTVLNLDLNKIKNGKKFLYFKLHGTTKSTSEFYYNENDLATIKFLKISDGQEVPMKIEELKDGDQITIEEKLDLTKFPSDQKSKVEEIKITKL